MNFYSKVYFTFYLLSGKKNNPELTAIMLMSAFMFFAFLIILFSVFVILQHTDVLIFSEFIKSNKNIFTYTTLGFGLLMVVINCLIFISRGPEIINKIKQDERLLIKLKKRRILLLLLSLSLITLIISFSGFLYN